MAQHGATLPGKLPRRRGMFYSQVRCAIERRLVEIPGTVLRVGGGCVASPSEGRSLTVDELFQ